MPEARVWPMHVQVGCDAAFLALILGLDGDPVVAADFTGITVWVKGQRLANPTVNNEVVATSTVTALVTNDPRWLDNVHEANVGRNFEHFLSPAAFPSADHYRVEYTFTFVGARKTKLIFEGPARSSNA